MGIPLCYIFLLFLHLSLAGESAIADVSALPQSSLWLVTSLGFMTLEPHRFRHMHASHIIYDFIVHLAHLARSPDLYHSQRSLPRLFQGTFFLTCLVHVGRRGRA